MSDDFQIVSGLIRDHKGRELIHAKYDCLGAVEEGDDGGWGECTACGMHGDLKELADFPPPPQDDPAAWKGVVFVEFE